MESAHPRRKNTILVTKQQHNANTAGLIKLHRPHFPNFATSSAKEQQTPILGCWSSEICAPFRWRYIHGVTSTLAQNAFDTVMHTALQTVGNLYHTLHKLIWQRNKQSSYLHQLRWILCMSFTGPSAFHSSVEGGCCCCWCDASSASSRAAASWVSCFPKIKKIKNKRHVHAAVGMIALITLLIDTAGRAFQTNQSAWNRGAKGFFWKF